jgi:hypothetical protein
VAGRVRPIVWVVAIAITLLLISVTYGIRHFGGHTEGPLLEPPKIAYVITVKPGRVITDGSIVLDLRGREDATIVRVTSVGDDANLEFLGAKVVGPHRRYTSTQWAPGWPPEHFQASSVIDPVGATLRPSFRTWKRQAYELLLGYRVLRPSYGMRSAVTVAYRVGGRQFESRIFSIIVTCPPDTNQEKCLYRGFDSVSPTGRLVPPIGEVVRVEVDMFDGSCT